MKIAPLLALLCSVAGSAFGQGRPARVTGALDGLIQSEVIWESTLEGFGKAYQGIGFNWLSSAKVALRSVHPRLSLDGHRVGETVVRAKDGKISQISISLYNRGDNGIIAVSDFWKVEAHWIGYLNRILGFKPEDRSDSKDAVANQKRLVWFMGTNAYLLESSVTRFPEFLRLQIVPKPTGAGYLGTGATAKEATHRSDLRRNVVRERNGDTFIGGIPMVDQGEKGACAVATAERVFRYYGLPVDQHEMAQISVSSAAFGTSPDMMIDALGKVAAKVKLRPQTIIEWDSKKFVREVENYNRAAKKKGLRTYNLKRFNFGEYYATLDPDVYLEVRTKGTSYRSFENNVIRTIDQGIPLLWGVELGIFPEAAIPQARGGHMRLIIGYNGRDKEIIYSDSWGEGHAKKRISIGAAYAMTNGLYTLSPTR